MKILVFEGIATSGKSTIINDLVDDLSANTKLLVARETETHMPIMDRKDESHVNFYLDLIKKYVDTHSDLVFLTDFILHRLSGQILGWPNINELKICLHLMRRLSS